jgi:type II secretory ATPase GspE/PulE/Tfp pilus assembly ATPase PilB-like protein
MGLEPFLIASTVRIVIGQRLIRRICPVCREDYEPDDGVITRIKTTFGFKNESDMARIHKLEGQALESGIGAKDFVGKRTTSDLSTTDKNIRKLWKTHDGGCDNCSHTGYHGRLGIYEVLQNSSPVQKLIVANGTSEDLEVQSVHDGMVTMQLDGFVKALRGQTTLEEVMRVTATEG